jgi:hypothetical protein
MIRCSIFHDLQLADPYAPNRKDRLPLWSPFTLCEHGRLKKRDCSYGQSEESS